MCPDNTLTLNTSNQACAPFFVDTYRLFKLCVFISGVTKVSHFSYGWPAESGKKESMNETVASVTCSLQGFLLLGIGFGGTVSANKFSS